MNSLTVFSLSDIKREQVCKGVTVATGSQLWQLTTPVIVTSAFGIVIKATLFPSWGFIA